MARNRLAQISFAILPVDFHAVLLNQETTSDLKSSKNNTFYNSKNTLAPVVISTHK